MKGLSELDYHDQSGSNEPYSILHRHQSTEGRGSLIANSVEVSM